MLSNCSSSSRANNTRCIGKQGNALLLGDTSSLASFIQYMAEECTSNVRNVPSARKSDDDQRRILETKTKSRTRRRRQTKSSVNREHRFRRVVDVRVILIVFAVLVATVFGLSALVILPQLPTRPAYMLNLFDKSQKSKLKTSDHVTVSAVDSYYQEEEEEKEGAEGKIVISQTTPGHDIIRVSQKQQAAETKTLLYAASNVHHISHNDRTKLFEPLDYLDKSKIFQASRQYNNNNNNNQDDEEEEEEEFGKSDETETNHQQNSPDMHYNAVEHGIDDANDEGWGSQIDETEQLLSRASAADVYSERSNFMRDVRDLAVKLERQLFTRNIPHTNNRKPITSMIRRPTNSLNDKDENTISHNDNTAEQDPSNTPAFVAIGSREIIRRDFPAIKQALMQSLHADVSQAADYSAAVRNGRIPANYRSVRRAGDFDAILCFSLDTDKCFSTAEFQRIQSLGASAPRINRMMGLKHVLWNKGNFCRTMKRAVKKTPWLLGEFTFPCWVLPSDYDKLYSVASTALNENKQWIIKPLKMGGGKGIFIVDGVNDLANRLAGGGAHVVQPYLPNPHLIHGRKWDLRTYVLITSAVPMRAYVYSDGLVRFATDRYNSSAATGGSRTQFLTNTSINKRKNGNMSSITWPFTQLEKYMLETSGDPLRFKQVHRNLDMALGMMLLAAESGFQRHFETVTHSTSFRCSSCYHLLGVDFILDSQHNARVIEVNGEPSMKLTNVKSSAYDATKLTMQSDMSLLIHRGGDKVCNRVSSLVMQDLRLVKAMYANTKPVSRFYNAEHNPRDEENSAKLNPRGVFLRGNARRKKIDEDHGNNNINNSNNNNNNNNNNDENDNDQRNEHDSLVGVASSLEWLTQTDLEYLLHMRRESGALGGFRRVYPNTWSVSGAHNSRSRKRWDTFVQGLDLSISRRRMHDLLTRFETIRMRRCEQIRARLKNENGNLSHDRFEQTRRDESHINLRQEAGCT